MASGRTCGKCGERLTSLSAGNLCLRCILTEGLAPEEGGPEGVAGFEFRVSSELSGSTESGDVNDRGEARPAEGLKVLGDYELLEEIARGGMGVVYRARQRSLNRVVAVKTITAGRLAERAQVERFRAEAEAAASLQHPHIVAIHEVGEAGGQHYFSMDYVPGRNLAELARERPLPGRAAALYLRKVAEAVHYAHRHGIIHRDLKPSNILIDANDEPRVTDFGLAKRLSSAADLTLSGQVVGSPSYLSPEQAAGQGSRAGPASDVYALGAILYHLLTGRPPFQAETLTTLLKEVQEAEPVGPRRLNASIPRDLETICLKCLEKEAGRRYGTAQALADELGRYLDNEPIEARPVGLLGRGWRWCRRKPALAGALAACLAILMLGAIGITLQWRRAEQNARELRRNLYVADINVAYRAVEDDNFQVARELVLKYLPRSHGAQDGQGSPMLADAAEDLRGWEWRYLWRRCQSDALAVLRGHTGFVSCAMFSPNGSTLATAGFDQTVRIWDVATRRALRLLTGFSGPLQRNSVVFSPDGRLLAAADGTEIHLFEAGTWNKLRSLKNPTGTGRIYSLPIAFSPDGKTLSCNAETEIRHWDTGSWERRVSQPANLVGEFGRLLAYSPDGRHLATARDRGIVLWDMASNPPGQRSLGVLFWPSCVAFSPDGKLVAAGGQDDFSIVWDVTAGKEIVRLSKGEEMTLAMSFSPDGSRLASGGTPVVRMWETERWGVVSTFKEPLGGADVLGFSPDGGALVLGSTDGPVRLCSSRPKTIPEGVLTVGGPLGFSADSRILAVFSTNSSVQYWDVRSGRMARSFRIPATVSPRDSILASFANGWVAQVSTEGMARVWDSDSGAAVAELALEPAPVWPQAAFSPDGGCLAIACSAEARGGKGWTLLWDIRQGQRRALPGSDVYGPAFSPDGRILATGVGNDAQLWSLPELKPLARLRGHKTTIYGFAFSRDGALLASSSREGGLNIWELASGRLQQVCSPQGAKSLRPAAFSSDGRTIACGASRKLALLNVATGKVILPIKGAHRALGAPIFSPDGNTLVIGGGQGSARWAPVEVLHAPSLAEIEAAERTEARPR